MSQHDNPAHLLILDLESTQADPYHQYAAVLELGAILVRWDPELTEVARASMLIRPPGNTQDHEMIWQHMPPVVQQMHRDNGLWAESTNSDEAWQIHEADRAITDWLTGFTNGEPVTIAGSGVGHLDLPFVKVLMPHLASQLTYYPVDFGNFRRMLTIAGRVDQVDKLTDVTSKPHRALGDAELHLAEARRYLQWLREEKPVVADAAAGDPGRV